MFLKRLFRGSVGSRTLQEDLDLYRASVLVSLCNSGSSDVDSVSRSLLQQGRSSWARVLRSALGVQMHDLFAHVALMGGADAYPMPKQKRQKVLQGSPLERALDMKGRDLDIEEKPVAHPSAGWKMRVAKSGIQHRAAGFGVVVEGFVPAGSVVCIYPGKIWWPGTYAGPPDNEYAISRYDGVIVDALHWDTKARESAMQQHARLEAGASGKPEAEERFRNPFALGSFVNHPPPGEQPNVMQVPYEFKKDLRYVPHEMGSDRRPLYMLDSFLDSTPSIVLIATRNLRDEELFLNYRFNPALPYPDWYSQPDLEEATRRWAKHSFFFV